MYGRVDWRVDRWLYGCTDKWIYGQLLVCIVYLVLHDNGSLPLRNQPMLRGNWPKCHCQLDNLHRDFTLYCSYLFNYLERLIILSRWKMSKPLYMWHHTPPLCMWYHTPPLCMWHHMPPLYILHNMSTLCIRNPLSPLRKWHYMSPLCKWNYVSLKCIRI